MKKENIISKNNTQSRKEIKNKEIKNSEKGLIKTILIVIIAVFVISYFDIDMKALMGSETTKNNFHFVGELLEKVWNILKPIWDTIWSAVGPIVKEKTKEAVVSQL